VRDLLNHVSGKGWSAQGLHLCRVSEMPVASDTALQAWLHIRTDSGRDARFAYKHGRTRSSRLSRGGDGLDRKLVAIDSVRFGVRELPGHPWNFSHKAIEARARIRNRYALV
jgi:hypothetical protein